MGGGGQVYRDEGGQNEMFAGERDKIIGMKGDNGTCLWRRRGSKVYLETGQVGLFAEERKEGNVGRWTSIWVLKRAN